MPEANFGSPLYRKIPARLPVLDFTMTRSPTSADPVVPRSKSKFRTVAFPAQVSANQLCKFVILDVLVTLCVGEVVPERTGDAIERKLNSERRMPSGLVDADSKGSRVSRVRREKMPFLGSHWK